MTNITAKTILVVDDEEELRQTVADELEDLDYRVLTAENGRIGVEVFEREGADLVLLDLMMPEMSGLEVLSRLASTSPDTPVIVVSGTGVIGDAVEALRQGAWDFLLKPINDLSVLAHAVEMALEKARLLTENRAYRERLEQMVAERTQELNQKSAYLEKVNAALKASLDHREVEKRSVEENLLKHIKKFVAPYIAELSRCRLPTDAEAYANILETNINNIVSDFSQTISTKYLDFTPTEVRIADLIRDGKETTEIAGILKLSPASIHWYRKRIRKKLGLKDQKINLYVYLNSLTP